MNATATAPPSHVGPAWDELCESEPGIAVSLRRRVRMASESMDSCHPGWFAHPVLGGGGMPDRDRSIRVRVVAELWGAEVRARLDRVSKADA